MSSMKNKHVIILLGPTAVGKTGVSILLAKLLKTEIISADSMQVYRHMDLGTAKPSAAELKQVPHHLINILSPDQSFSAGMFRERSTEIIDALHRENKIPVIVGGTGLYIRTLTKGLFEGPSADWTLRQRLMEEEKTKGRGYLYQKLCSVDPSAAMKIEKNDLRRTIRALEVSLKDNRTISELHAVSTKPGEYDFIKIGLYREKKELYGFIEKRIDSMIDKGLLHETEELLKMNPDRMALQAIGYKEMLLYLRGQTTFEEAVRLLKKHTKMYAKRQTTWFKKEPDVTWVDVTGITDAEKIFTKMISEVDQLRKVMMNNDNADLPDI